MKKRRFKKVILFLIMGIFIFVGGYIIFKFVSTVHGYKFAILVICLLLLLLAFVSFAVAINDD